MADVDLALDPFPYGGSTTTLDCLWMGLPVVTLDPGQDARMASRWHLGLVGLSDLVQPTPDGYVETAIALARDPLRLSALRRDLRPRMRASPLCDGHRYAREVEYMFRFLWETWLRLRARHFGTHEVAS
jgi:predicted O-linked N-acetylglucosamine transferase (SPINDLY family)